MAAPGGQTPYERDEAPSTASVDALARLLRSVVGSGLDHIAPDTHSDLLGLPAVHQRAQNAAYPDTADGRALAARDVIYDALAAMGDGAYPDAARLLFGAAADTRGRSRAERRRIAAYHLDIAPSTFRRNYEPRVLRDVATEVYRAAARDGTTDNSAPTETEPAEGDSREGEPARQGEPIEALPHPTDTADMPDVPDVSGAAVGVGTGGRAPFVVVPQPVRRGRWWGSGADRVALVALAGGVAWWRWGLDTALLLVAAPALVLWGVWLVAKMATGQGWVEHLPRFGVVVILLVLVTGRLTTSGDDPREPAADTCTATEQIAGACGNEDDDGSRLGTVEVPPPTYISAQSPSEPTCPDEGGEAARRTNFTQAPPMCINPDQDLVATVYTNLGEFTIRLIPDESPQGVNSFVFLARWGYYDGIVLDATPPYPVTPGVEACKADWGSLKDCVPHLNDYIRTHYIRAQPPFDPDTEDYGPGWHLESEPASSPYDEGRHDVPEYAILPHYSTTEGDNGSETHYVNPSDFAIAATPEGKQALNESPELYTPIGIIDDPDHVVITSMGDNTQAGRWTPDPIIVDTIIVETPDERDARLEREELQEELDKLDKKIADLEQEFDEKLNPPWGEEPAEREDLDWEEHQKLLDEREVLQDAIDATYSG